MSKVLIIGDFSKDSEYAFWAESEVQLLRDHFDVSIRCIHNRRSEGDLQNIDLVLHVVHPENYKRISGAPNIGWAIGEKDFYHPMCNLLDDVVDSNKLHPMPKIIDKGKLPNAKKVNIDLLNGEFVIYTINDDFDNSRTLEIVKEFHKEFDAEEPVSLVIKTNRKIDNEVTNLKNHLGIYPNINLYKKEIVVTGQQSYDDMFSMHVSFNCFVDSSYGEIKRHIEIAKSLNKFTTMSDVRSVYEGKTEINNAMPTEKMLNSHIVYLKESIENARSISC